MQRFDIFGRSRRLDTTQGDLKRPIGVLGVFFTAELTLHFLAGLFIIWLIARLGPDHLSAVTLSLTITGIAYSFYLELGLGVTTLVAQRIGARDRVGAGQVIGQVLLLNIFLSFPIALGGTWFAPQLLQIMGADPHVMSLGVPYLQGWLGLLFFFPIPFLLNAALRALGDTATVTVARMQELVTLILLGPALVFGAGPIPGLGITGTVLATGISRIFSVFIQFWALRSHRATIMFDWNSFQPHFPTMRNLISLAIPATGQQLVRFGAEAVVVRLIASFGVVAIAAYAISQRLVQGLETVGNGIGNAAFTVVGQNIGARQGGRALRGTWIAVLYSLVLNGAGILIFVFWASPLIAVFNTDEQVVLEGVAALRIVGISFVFTAIALVLIRSFHGVGDTISPVVIDAIALWGVQLALALGLSAAGWGSTGIWIAIAAAQVVRGVLLIMWFLSRRLHLVFNNLPQPGVI